jgi:C1A family cysteine protease
MTVLIIFSILLTLSCGMIERMFCDSSFCRSPSRRKDELDQQGHAVVIVGVALDELGQPKYWKIKNSWSTKVGAQGYFNMYTDFARNYVKSITFLGSIDLNSNRFVY